MGTDKKEYKILIIEDNAGDLALIEDFLYEQIENPRITAVQSFNEAKSIFSDEHQIFDIILLDLSLPDMVGEPLINGIRLISVNTPIIVLTGYSDFNFGVKSISLGVSDYILKDELTPLSLYKSIVYSVERKRIATDLEESEKKYSELFHLSPLPMWVYDCETLQFLNVNKSAIRHYGFSRTEFLSMTIRDIRPPEDLNELEVVIAEASFPHESMAKGIHNHKKKNGQIIKVDIQSNPIIYRSKKAKVVLANDVTERLNYVKAVEEQNEKLRQISWIQSHIVRAPLARIMGLVPLIKDLETTSGSDQEKMLEYLLLSAQELDDMIREITEKTKITDYRPPQQHP